MNHVYRIVWNHVACTWQAVAESAKGFGKGRQGERRAHLSLQPSPKFSIKPLLAALSLISSSAWAGPQGGQVVAGSATIQQAGNTTTINQSTNRAAIDWTSFSVGKAESVRFNQPSTSAITLNRVTGTESSQILGSVSANGQVFILNPNGVLFGKGAQVNVGGLVASTHGMSNADFMDGNYQLSGNGTGAVINQGKITVIEGGTIALIAPIVKNTGTLTANRGSVLLAAADAVSLKLQDGSLIGYTLDKGSLQALVDNGGVIHAEGGHVVLTAKALDALSKATINHSGIIEAQTVANKNGVVELLGDMQVGEIKLSGKIDASAPNGGDGGFVETSAAKVRVLDGHRVTTLATQGQTGTWLIDPNDYTIAASGGDITGTQLSSDLGSSNITIQSSSGATAGNGDINVNDLVSWSANKLTLSAQRNININAKLNGSGSASFALEYGQGNLADGNGADYFIKNGATINLPAGWNFYKKLGSDGASLIYYVITDLGVEGDTSTTTLQGMKNRPFGANCVLGADIDASVTRLWNSGAGWEPIGVNIQGLGHTIKNIYINRPATNMVGFISQIGYAGTVRDIGIENIEVYGGSYVGGLAGSNAGKVFNSYVTGQVNSSQYWVGGVFGVNIGNVDSVYSAVLVKGYYGVGGFVGVESATVDGKYVGLISNSYSTGSVYAVKAVGGFVGQIQTGNILNSYSSGYVHVADDLVRDSVGPIGGFAGINLGSGWTAGSVGIGQVLNSYWDIEKSGQTTSAEGSGKTSSNLLKQSEFNGWDFSGTWRIYEGQSTPVLRTFQKSVVVTANDASRIYDGTAFLGGNGVSNSAGSAPLIGNVTYGGDSQGAINAGAYTISASGLSLNRVTQQDYQNWSDIAYKDGKLVIDRAKISLISATGERSYDGTANAYAQDVTSLTGVFAGDSVQVVSGTGELDGKNVGERNLVSVGTLTLGGSDSSNYQLVVDGSKWTILKRSISLNGVREYDASNKAYAEDVYPLSGVLAADKNFVSVVSGTGILAGANAGEWSLNDLGTLTLGGSAAGNYQLMADGSKWTILKRPLTIIANDATKIYGEPDPKLSYFIASGGLVDGETLSGVLSRAAGENVIDGGYAIQRGTLSAGNNYTITFDDSLSYFEIKPRPVYLIGERTYNGTNKAYQDDLVDWGGVLPADGSNKVYVAFSGYGYLDSAEVGNRNLESIGSLRLEGSSAGNYVLTTAGSRWKIKSATQVDCAVANACPGNNNSRSDPNYNIDNGSVNWGVFFEKYIIDEPVSLSFGQGFESFVKLMEGGDKSVSTFLKGEDFYKMLDSKMVDFGGNITADLVAGAAKAIMHDKFPNVFNDGNSVGYFTDLMFDTVVGVRTGGPIGGASAAVYSFATSIMELSDKINSSNGVVLDSVSRLINSSADLTARIAKNEFNSNVAGRMSDLVVSNIDYLTGDLLPKVDLYYDFVLHMPAARLSPIIKKIWAAKSLQVAGDPKASDLVYEIIQDASLLSDGKSDSPYNVAVSKLLNGTGLDALATQLRPAN